MDLRRLRYFVSVANEKSFLNASKKLNISQPALSRRIQEFERDLGVPLFYRHARGTVLTDTGSMLLLYANEIFNLVKMAEEACRKKKPAGEESLSVGATPTPSSTLLPKVVQFCSSMVPPVKLSVVQGSSRELLSLLSDGTLDAVFCYSNPDNELQKIKSIPLFSEDCFIIGSAEILGVTSDAFNFKGIGEIPLILDPPNYIMRQKVEEIAIHQQLRLNVQAALEPNHIKLELIRRHGWATIAPYSFLVSKTGEEPALIARKIVNPKITITLQLAFLASNPAPKRAKLFGICKAVVDNIIEDGEFRWRSPS